MEFKIVLRENHLAQKLIRLHTPEQNGIVEWVNKTMRESLVPVILTDYEQAKHELFKSSSITTTGEGIHRSTISHRSSIIGETLKNFSG